MKLDEEIPTWLPELILLKNFNGNWELYLQAIFRFFLEDFVQGRPFFQQLPIFVRCPFPWNWKEGTFWHLISEGEIESERLPNLRRCERIRWPRAILDHFISKNIKVWETTRPWKNQQQKRLNFALEDFSYLVVIAKRERGFDLVTAYCIEQSHRRARLRKEFATASIQKKEGAAI